MQKLKNITRTTLSNDWATLHRIDYDYQFEDGEWRRLSRETYNRGNGSGILLYNTKKSTVILTKQFRMPVYDVNKNEGMSIEVCAGAIDNNDSPKATIIREVEEEVGYRISDATQVLSAYTSPGALTEKMYLFIAEYTDDMKVNEGGGLEIENEDIEVLELPFSKAIEMVKNEEIIDAKTIMLLQYAQINKIV
ncbi:NUDIX domain-containing protein [Winogradskyella sp. SYSU M77433]|uniref:NUDIX domain-containing protein n=1 Tax=Winogradskyella sp. SYSU M77433 TaxID=3042722 RepID=UPI00247FC490|nr:NUDIX domain-containing protein [Winogradskyella sp. SYSU M77433]MDH7912522.1 NUDIX domain-containing protein [Winogradskyella sp. SYSU M77433]